MAIGSKELADFRAALAKNAPAMITDQENREAVDRDVRNKIVTENAHRRRRSISRRTWLLVGIVIVIGIAAIWITGFRSWHS